MATTIRKLQRSAPGSLSITIPAEIVKSLQLREHQRMTVKKIAGAIVIRDAKTKKKQ